MAPKDVIIKFKRGTEIAEREAALEDIKKSGGSIVKTDNLASSIFPYAVVALSDEGFQGLTSSLAGHNVIEKAELDQTVTIQK